ncbi:MAG: ACT domain-containing protein [Planctomycetota bacterium]
MEHRPRIRRLGGAFSIHRLSAGAPLPQGIADEPMVWIGRTDAELSVVCRERPERAAWGEVSGGWGVLEVEGPLDFTIVGLLAEITTVLAGAEISVFALSTFDTDYVLVPGDRLDEAVDRLGDAGFAPYA